jgi:PPIC-type PPIASE domain
MRTCIQSPIPLPLLLQINPRMKIFVGIIWMLFCLTFTAKAQDMDKMKAELAKSANPIALVKDKWKKKYKIDTVVIVSPEKFLTIADSIAYTGKVGSVHGPFPKEKILVKILVKAPNTFYRFSQILIDTSSFSPKFADSLANSIIKRVKSGEASFEEMAQVYTMDGNANNGGDAGWMARGSMMPSAEKQIAARKKGDVFKLKSRGGVYVVKITQKPRTDTGFALVLRVLM